MEDYVAEALVNRDEPIPVISVLGSDGAGDEEPRSKLEDSTTSSKLKDSLHDAGLGRSDSTHSLQDRLFAKLLQQIIPAEDNDDATDAADKKSIKVISRPGFSLPLMTNNFRRFNARIGVVFVFQNQMIRLLTWQTTTHTLSLLAVYTFICLNPPLLSVLPFALALLFLLIPAFLSRHPPPPSSTILTSQYSIAGPALAPPRAIRPAQEMSKDFFRNMRDLQNCMDDFSIIHDAILAILTPPTNFSNEPLSSAVFFFLFAATCMLFLTAHLLPWRFISLVLGWTTVGLGHPQVQALVYNSLYKQHVQPISSTAHMLLDSWISSDIIIDSPPETREVEIFELQRRKGRGQEWESWIFSPTAWEPLQPARVAGDRPKGTRFFEDVVPPQGWEFSDKKWALDLGSREWVEERLVQGVEVEVEGERWVYDIDDGEDRPSEWRRRRWVRMVRRMIIRKGDAAGTKADSKKT